ncbi:metalloregulator ArsR/SmtB family transcription factor [Roseospira marina]|uniref:Metalloregulator ArsR/SmtB family transcription factor n=1 Tax=Roseospira marina TaxID=140057 RepID=A0A5M6IEC4_9PROT|nr:metalloregulator ArsR/SmtB family transcription factor [Roseospira marina]KAA5606603.1 metalloregulator ArsR/SmtB family transcription factor [Roseospira marina]MBB4313995.1 arsenate reductase [Roseospira marina]MBB5087157.1 arsenate reductase [Roseospira marina]
MNPTLMADMMAALAAEPRIRALQALVRAGAKGVPAGDLARRCDVAPSTMSFHLTQMRTAGLVESRREGRTLFYVASLPALEALGHGVMTGFCPAAMPGAHPPAPSPFAPNPFVPSTTGETTMRAPDREPPLTVLFLCRGNSARSQMAEAILSREGKGQFRAFSAGSHPRDTVHPHALSVLRRANLPVDALHPKSWDVFGQPDAPAMDFVFTVCDDAAGEPCPVWPGQPITAHWGVPDPAAFAGTDAATAAVFNDTFRMLYNRIALFVNLPLASLDRLTLRRRVDAIGALPRDPEATAPAEPTDSSVPA